MTMDDLAREAARRAVEDTIPRAEGERLHRLLLRVRAKRRALRVGIKRAAEALNEGALPADVRTALIRLLWDDERRWVHDG